jgi:hypothetical protein
MTKLCQNEANLRCTLDTSTSQEAPRAQYISAQSGLWLRDGTSPFWPNVAITLSHTCPYLPVVLDAGENALLVVTLPLHQRLLC